VVWCSTFFKSKVNDEFPGPTIRVKKGDQVRLSVANVLTSDEGLAMHFHGIVQKGTPWMDGTLDTQCPITPGGPAFLYDFTVADQTGTYFYHAHSSCHSTDGVYGAFIVEDPDAPFHYDEDRSVVPTSNPSSSSLVSLFNKTKLYRRVLLLADWWHKEGNEQAAGLLSQNFT